MLNKHFGGIYFHFSIFSEKKKQKTGVKICIFGFLKNVSQSGPLHTTIYQPNFLTRTTKIWYLANHQIDKQYFFSRLLTCLQRSKLVESKLADKKPEGGLQRGKQNLSKGHNGNSCNCHKFEIMTKEYGIHIFCRSGIG